MKLLGYLANLCNTQSRSRTKRHPPLFGPQLVLKDECPRSLLAYPKPESSHVIITNNSLAFAGSYLLSANHIRRPFHGFAPSNCSADRWSWSSAGNIMGRLAPSRRGQLWPE